MGGFLQTGHRISNMISGISKQCPTYDQVEWWINSLLMTFPLAVMRSSDQVPVFLFAIREGSGP